MTCGYAPFNYGELCACPVNRIHAMGVSPSIDAPTATRIPKRAILKYGGAVWQLGSFSGQPYTNTCNNPAFINDDLEITLEAHAPTYPLGLPQTYPIGPTADVRCFMAWTSAKQEAVQNSIWPGYAGSGWIGPQDGFLPQPPFPASGGIGPWGVGFPLLEPRYYGTVFSDSYEPLPDWSDESVEGGGPNGACIVKDFASLGTFEFAELALTAFAPNATGPDPVPPEFQNVVWASLRTFLPTGSGAIQSGRVYYSKPLKTVPWTHYTFHAPYRHRICVIPDTITLETSWIVTESDQYNSWGPVQQFSRPQDFEPPQNELQHQYFFHQLEATIEFIDWFDGPLGAEPSL